jgi:hypothetical protein
MEEFLKKSKPQECFRNALMVTKALNADYIEGYIIHAKMPKFPIRHAWNATEKGYLDITGEAHKLLDRKTVGLPGPFGNDRQPFRETCVYISLERWTAEKVIRQAKRTSRMALMIAGGSLCIANWAESNGFVPRGGCKTSRVT